MKRHLVLISFIALLTSCQSILTSMVTRKSITKEVKTLYNDELDQTIVFMPMVHLGKKGYYESARVIIDSLRKDGYSFYYESVGVKDSIDENKMLIYNKKMRSIIGYNIALDTLNRSLPKVFTKKKYEFQNYGKMGIKANDSILDLSKIELIDKLEKQYGEVKLSQCDLETGLFEKYDCESENSKYSYNITRRYRDKYITKRLKDIKQEKIVLIYGLNHWYGIWPSLRDRNFEIIQGKI